MSPRLVALTLFALLAVAGCLAPQVQDANSTPSSASSPASSTPSGSASMTASEVRSNESCSGQNSGNQAYCAAKKVRVDGAISGISRLDVDLHTVNGGVAIKNGDAGSWNLVATLKAYGSSPEEAQANLAKIRYTWSHVDGSTHQVHANADFSALNDCRCSPQASIETTLPAAVTKVVSAETTNGAISVAGKTDGLSASTTNGQISVDADVTQVQLQTTNGQITANLRPSASGRIHAATTNGQVVLELPEGESTGYDVHGKTTNGVVEIDLKDGDLGPCPQGSQYYTPPCTERSFKTHGYDARAVRTQVAADATNGQIVVKPA